MARAALGWSSAELARRAHVGAATVTRFETHSELIPATISAMQRALEDAGIIFEEADDGSAGVRRRRLREGDRVRFRPQSQVRPDLANKIAKVVRVEPHPPQTGPTYRVWVDFPDEEDGSIAGVFEFEYELVKAVAG
jgi:hypothetical protein